MYVRIQKAKTMVTLKFILDYRRASKEGNSTIKLRITHNRKQKYYLTGFKMSEDEFKQLMKDRPPKRLESTKIELDEIMLKARNTVKELGLFSFIGFERLFLAEKKVREDLFDLYNRVINEKTQNGAIGTASNYRCSMKSVKSFNPRLSLADITPTLLKEYEAHLISEGKQVTTIGIYLRPMRAIINEAITLGYLPKDFYPFGRKKYVIPEGRNPKKALDRTDFNKIWNYKTAAAYSFEDRSKDFFILSYLCQGVNFKDLLLLKKSQIADREIRFIRQKTKETGRSNPILITVPILNEAKEIIDKWKTKKQESEYVFDFISAEMTPEEIHKTNMQFVKVTNKYMNLIAGQVGIEKRVTTYVARHQFSKAIIDGGESIEYLSECLGHKNISTTQNYVQRFATNIKFEKAKHLLLQNE
jgi:integrase/recombinase XerD